MTNKKVTNQDANAVKLDLLSNLKGENTDNNNNVIFEETVIKIKIIQHNKKMFSIKVLKY